VIAVPLRRLSPKTCAAPAAATDLSPRTGAESAAPAAPDLSPGTGRKLALALALVATPACARATTPATTGVVVDPPAPYVTPAGDLVILRHRAAMGMTGAVRAELAPRLASAGDAPGADPGRDALRGLAIELALVQGDAEAAARELDRLERAVLDLGDGAPAQLRGLSAMLRGTWLFDQARYVDARSSHLRALAALERREPTGVQTGVALRGLARDQLALGEARTAVDTLARAIQIHTDQPEAHIELHEDLLLAVDVMIALQQKDEAVIVASDAYNQALNRFGSDTLPHAEALLMVGAATLASGDRGAAETVIGDARVILDRLQAERSDPRFPVSVRAVRRCAALTEMLARLTPV